MAEPHVVLENVTGLNNRIDPARLHVSEQNRISELAIANNVDIDSTGRISRRKGYTATARTEDIHSLFCENDICLYIVGTALWKLMPGFGAKGLRNDPPLTQGLKMRYVAVDNRVYYTNTVENGYVEGDTSYAWVKGTYVGPTTMKILSNPPVGKHLEVYNARVYISLDDVLWYTERFAYGAVDMARNFIQFDSQIIMVQAVVDGIYVGTSRSVWFLGGDGPDKFTKVLVAGYPAIEDTDAKAEGVEVGEGFPGRIPIWTSERGICLGLPGGELKNVTYRKLVLPTSTHGTGGIVNGRYIGLLEP